MMIIEKSTVNFRPPYPVEKLSDTNCTFFLDIETTGFSAKSSTLYLIGVLYYQNQNWQLCQWFAQNKNDEKEILQEFANFCIPYQSVIHFNGNGFDIPYLTQKYEYYKLESPLIDKTHIDLYKSIRPLKKLLKLDNLKQKTIELYLKIQREDPFTGGELISLYKEYVVNQDPRLQQVLLLHNHDDMIGMLEILPIQTYVDLFSGHYAVIDLEFEQTKDLSGNPRLEGVFSLQLEEALPVPIAYGTASIYLKTQDRKAFLKFPVYEGELKYFYPNYKEYYYLPTEDTALHKSVASYVDKEFRQQAKANTCYTKRKGTFLPQNTELFTPAFKKEVNSPISYFEYQQALSKDPVTTHKYSLHLLQCLLSNIIF